MSIASAISSPASGTLTARPAGRRTARGQLTSVPQNARTIAPAGVEQTQKAARGVVVYVGLDEATAGANGTNLTEVAHELQRYARRLVSDAQTQAVVALAPDGRGTDLDAVRAVVSGSPAATGGRATTHGPLRSRIPARVRPPADRKPGDTPSRGSSPQSGVLVDAPRREVHIDGGTADLTYKEFELLWHLVDAESETVTRQKLLDSLWSHGDEAPTDRTVDVHVRRLRGKLGPYASIIRTIRGRGYRYDPHPDVVVWRALAHRRAG